MRWLFGSPFREMSGVIGDPVPPELRRFEAEAEQIQHRAHGHVALSSAHRRRANPHKG
jgi:hypothetical protein